MPRSQESNAWRHRVWALFLWNGLFAHKQKRSLCLRAVNMDSEECAEYPASPASEPQSCVMCTSGHIPIQNSENLDAAVGPWQGERVGADCM